MLEESLPSTSAFAVTQSRMSSSKMHTMMDDNEGGETNYYEDDYNSYDYDEVYEDFVRVRTLDMYEKWDCAYEFV